MRKSLPFRPLALRNRLSPIVPLSVQPALQRVAQMIVFFLELFWTVQRRFSFQIKTPLTAHTALQGGYKVSLAAGCHAEDKLRLGPSGFAAPAFTGFHRLCLYLYLHPFPGVMHRFSVDVCCLRRYAKGAYRTSLHGRTKSPASALSNLSYIKCTPLQAALSTVFL